MNDECERPQSMCSMLHNLINKYNGVSVCSLHNSLRLQAKNTIIKVDMARESKLHIYTQQSKINGFSQFLACKE